MHKKAETTSTVGRNGISTIEKIDPTGQI